MHLHSLLRLRSLLGLCRMFTLSVERYQYTSQLDIDASNGTHEPVQNGMVPVPVTEHMYRYTSPHGTRASNGTHAPVQAARVPVPLTEHMYTRIRPHGTGASNGTHAPVQDLMVPGSVTERFCLHRNAVPEDWESIY